MLHIFLVVIEVRQPNLCIYVQVQHGQRIQERRGKNSWDWQRGDE